VKYTPENGRVSLEGKEAGAWVQIVVRDSGPGIDPQHMPYLFERFYRAEADRGRRHHAAKHGGAGLGLAMVYEIARTHAGKVTAKSTPGKGSVFTVQLHQGEAGEHGR
jgi:two-component system sensor histidine kinase BaeS